MADLLYRWPGAAAFGKRVPKEKFYAHGATAAARELLVAQVQRITWAYKLSEGTINLPGTPAVPEIQVLVVEAKSDDIPGRVLAAIDAAIPFPIIFEITRAAEVGAEVRMTAAYKQLGGGTPKFGSYYSTAWLGVDSEREPLPTAIGLEGLYAALLQPLTPLTSRTGERAAETADRLAAARRLEREIAALAKKLHAEPQLSRKIDLRRQLKERQSALSGLVNPAPSTRG